MHAPSPAPPARLRRSCQPLALLAAALLAACGAGSGGQGGEPEVRGEGLRIVRSEPATIGPGVDPHFERANFHSFGNVPDGRVVRHVFRLQNTDERPMTIKRITPGCGCTIPRMSYTDAQGNVVQGAVSNDPGRDVLVIPPGVVAELEVAMETGEISTKNTNKTISITISTDSPNSYYVTLEVHVFVEQAFVQTPHGIDFGRVPRNGRSTGTLELVRMPGYQLEITEVLEKPDDLEVELTFDPTQPAAVWRLEATLLPPLALGLVERRVLLGTADPEGQPGEPLTVRLLAQQVEDIDVEPMRIVFAGREAGSSGRVSVESLLPGHTFAVSSLVLPDEHRGLLVPSAEVQSPDASGRSATWHVVMTAPEPIPAGGLLSGELRVLLDDPQHPEVRIPYVVHPPPG